ncbi:MAG: hypothetical protein MRZ79_08645 [Bacteroidia bacterium]|nr:hypothetical protein [Bacteroidia bacterium]
MKSKSVEETFEEFCRKLLPETEHSGTRNYLKRYIQNIPGPEATLKLLRYMIEQADRYHLNPAEFTTEDLTSFSQDIILHVDLDMVNIDDNADLRRQMAVSKEIIRIVILARGKAMLQEDPIKGKETLLNLASRFKRIKQERNGRIKAFMEVLDIDGLLKALELTPLQDNIPPQPTRAKQSPKNNSYLIWIGEPEHLEKLAEILKEDHDWIPKKKALVKAIPSKEVSIPDSPVIWQGDAVELVILIHLLKEAKLIKANKGKGVWKPLENNIKNYSELFSKKSPAKTLTEIKSQKGKKYPVFETVKRIIALAERRSKE